MFDEATAKNALAVPGAAIRSHGRPAPIMADCGRQSCANEKENAVRGASRFEKRFAELGIRQVLAGIHHPQSNAQK